MTRQMVMVGFLQAQNCTNLPSSWRHPESRTDATSADFYAEIGRVLEAGKFHMAFFDDRFAMPDRYGGDHSHTVEYGIRCVKMDPVVTMMAMGLATSRMGIASTASTTYFEPFDVARTFATADLMLQGRVGWNVVTSVNDGEAHNMGRKEHLEHDARYDRADEFMEVVMGHWDSLGRRCADHRQEKRPLRRSEQSAPARSSRKILQFARTVHGATSPQGHPVIIQAGASGRGKRFAGRWGEVIFASAHTTEFAQQAYKAFKDEAAAVGRDPDKMFICLGVMCVAGATKSEAEDKMAMIEKLPLEIDALSLLAEGLNFDFATKSMDEPMTRCRVRLAHRYAHYPRSCHQDQRQAKSDGARFSQIQQSRPDPRLHCRWTERNRGLS